VSLDLLADNLIGRAEVVLDLGDLACDARHEVHVGGVGRCTGYRDEVEDLGFFALAVAVDAADALFEAGGVERDVEVHQPVAVGLEVDALARGVGGEQDANRLFSWVGGELRADVLAVLGRVEPWITARRSST
jgi:hypothetical protein